MNEHHDEERRSAPPERSDSAPRRGGEAAAGRLEKRTHLNTGNYKIIFRDYGDGLAEIGWSFVPVTVPPKSGKGNSSERLAHEDRANRRARSRLRQLILSTGADHLLTLTYRENVTNHERACADLTKFVRLVRRKLPSWIYIAVAEQQKRGAWHWHLAVCGRQDVNLLRSAWLRAVGDGNIDVTPPRGTGRQRALSLVRYLGKYLAKGFDGESRELNGRRFRTSLGIVVPESSHVLPRSECGNAAGFALDQLKAHAGEVGYVWTSDKTFAGWACSWK